MGAPARVRKLRPSIAAVPNFDAPEVFAHVAIDNIVRALPPFERVYSRIRFSILRPKLLSVMDLLLPDAGRVLDVGCGFGLFAAYFGQTQPRREIIGIDPNTRRIATAERVARSVGLKNHRFISGDVRDANLQGPFDAVYMLDVMHHIPADAQRGVLQRLYDLLVPGGVLLMKDITTEPHYQLVFTEVLDRVMVGWNEPLAYRHHRAWGELLNDIGFRTRMVRVPDVLPYPHVVIACTKQR